MPNSINNIKKKPKQFEQTEQLYDLLKILQLLKILVKEDKIKIIDLNNLLRELSYECAKHDIESTISVPESKHSKIKIKKLSGCRSDILKRYSNEFKNNSNKNLKEKFNQMAKAYYKKYKLEIPENEIPQINLRNNANIQ